MVVKTALSPELSPGRLVHIESAVFKGMAIIERLRFKGATFGEAWDTELVVRRPFKSFFFHRFAYNLYKKCSYFFGHFEPDFALPIFHLGNC